MKKAIVGALLMMCQFVIAFSQNIVDELPRVSLYATQSYVEPKDMSGVRMAVYDARRSHDDDLLYYFRRYFDDVYLAHPSVLVNNIVPSYFVVVATDVAELRSTYKLISSFKKRRSTSVVLLYGGRSSDLAEAPLMPYNAVFVTENSSDVSLVSRCDVLTQAFFGGVALDMPSEYLTLNDGSLVGRAQPKTRLSYASPESVGMDSHVLADIDKIADEMISGEASPGCYVLIARKGTVVWSKAYGRSMYRDGREVKWDDLYDIASVSKAFGTLPVVMRMFDEGRLAPDMRLGDFLNELDSAKAEISVSDLLQHQSGLAAGIAVYQLCVDSSSFVAPLYSNRKKGDFTIRIENRLYMSNKARVKPGLFSKHRSTRYPVQVSTSNYTSDSMRMALLDYVDNSKMLRKSYRYSDLNFIYLQQIAERVYDRPLDRLFDMFVARPLGIRRMLYRPMEQYELEDIIPTENDRYMRYEQVWGTVHDQTAALLGGVAGNAGLFASANELAKVAQMYLWRGSYGGVQLINTATVDDFSSRHSINNRRGYGFDKPDMSGGVSVCDQASQSSYGHSGFSGTLAWVDPEYDLVYIFLSNRICPDAFNTKLTATSVRSNIHEVAYKAIVQK
ncbi:MAG: serine hydrolase [Bacteroidales bacterium]|nr:serine hydrolase [Bacteroidales bacterium]